MSMGFYDIARKARLESGAANEPVSRPVCGLMGGPVSALTRFTHLMRGLFLQLILLAALLQLALFSTLAPHSQLSQFSPSTLFSPLSPQDTLTTSGTPSGTSSGMLSGFGHSGSAYSVGTPITPLRGGDFTPVVGDIKGGFECSASVSWSTCLGAVMGIIPILGDGAKILIKRGRETLEASLGKTGKLDVDIPDELATNGGARFISRADGQTLDTSKINIPGPTNSPYGKMDYLLGKVPGNQDSIGKGGYFGGTLGFKSGDDLSTAMQSHLKNNFGSAVIKGNKVEVTAPITGPNGVTANVKAAWQIKSDGTVGFVTALPGPKLP